MKGDRHRQPVKSDYYQALGHAIYCFAICEWQVVWCCEKIRNGKLNNIVKGELTAGKIAKCFKDLVRNMPKSNERDKLLKSAEKFFDLTDNYRNAIVHAKPCTGPNGEARLSGRKIFEISDLEDAADAFSECAIELNDLYYNFLIKYQSI